jgi:hypothetical protein
VAACAKFAPVLFAGGGEVYRNVEYFNLDVIILVGDGIAWHLKMVECVTLISSFRI